VQAAGTAPGVGVTEKLLPAAPALGAAAPVAGHAWAAHGGAATGSGRFVGTSLSSVIDFDLSNQGNDVGH